MGKVLVCRSLVDCFASDSLISIQVHSVPDPKAGVDRGGRSASCSQALRKMNFVLIVYAYTYT